MANGVEVPCESSGFKYRTYIVDTPAENGGGPCMEYVYDGDPGIEFVDGKTEQEPCTRTCPST